MNRQYTCDGLAESVGINHGSVYTILTRHLKMQQVAARWVPQHLTRDQITHRVETSKMSLNTV